MSVISKVKNRTVKKISALQPSEVRDVHIWKFMITKLSSRHHIPSSDVLVMGSTFRNLEGSL